MLCCVPPSRLAPQLRPPENAEAMLGHPGVVLKNLAWGYPCGMG